MKLKGNYSAGTSYSVGDIVIDDGRVYHLQNPAVAGTHPTNSLYWGLMGQKESEQILLLADSLATAVTDVTTEVEAKIPDNISDDAILLKGTTDPTAEFIVQVDDSGLTPELTVDAYTEPEADGGDEG